MFPVSGGFYTLVDRFVDVSFPLAMLTKADLMLTALFFPPSLHGPLLWAGTTTFNGPAFSHLNWSLLLSPFDSGILTTQSMWLSGSHCSVC